MSKFLENIGSILSQLLTWLGNVATSLIGNEIFQIMVAIVIFTLLFGLMVGLVKDLRNKKRDNKKIESMPYYNLDNDEDEPVNVEELWGLKTDDEYDDYLDSLNGNNDNY